MLFIQFWGDQFIEMAIQLLQAHQDWIYNFQMLDTPLCIARARGYCFDWEGWLSKVSQHILQWENFSHSRFKWLIPNDQSKTLFKWCSNVSDTFETLLSSSPSQRLWTSSFTRKRTRIEITKKKTDTHSRILWFWKENDMLADYWILRFSTEMIPERKT